MIIKKMDSKEQEIAELEALLKTRLTPRQRFAMERELKPESRRQKAKRSGRIADRRWQVADNK